MVKMHTPPNANKLTFQRGPRCTVQTLNSSQAAGLGAPYSRECICGDCNWYIKVLTLALVSGVGR
jgi:hypothetical protein